MGWLSDAYDWVDTNIAQGALPGGTPLLAKDTLLGGGVQGVLAAPAPAQIGAPQLAGGGLFGGGAALQAAQGIAVRAPAPNGAIAARGRGRTVTAVATVYEDGTIIPRRMLPGSPVAMSSDISAVKRLKTAKKRLNKAIPSLRASKGKC